MLPVLMSTLLEKAHTEVFGGGGGFQIAQHKMPKNPQLSLPSANTGETEAASTLTKISFILVQLSLAVVR